MRTMDLLPGEEDFDVILKDPAFVPKTAAGSHRDGHSAAAAMARIDAADRPRGTGTAQRHASAVATGIADLAAWLTEQTWSDFAQSLASQYRRSGRLSDKQIAAASSMRAKCEAKKAPAAAPVAPAAPAPRTNRFAGKCENCQRRVEEGEGVLTKSDEGKWEVAHRDGECPASEFPFPLGSYAVENAEGVLRFYHVNLDGLFVLASDNLHRVHANAQAGVIAAIAADPEAASRRFGMEFGQCGRCGRGLTDEASREQGIGPICAQKDWEG